MIDVNPIKRLSATTYLTTFSKDLFPSYFQRLFEFYKVILTPKYASVDSRINYLLNNYDDVFRNILFTNPPPLKTKERGRKRENSLYYDLPNIDDNREYNII